MHFFLDAQLTASRSYRNHVLSDCKIPPSLFDFGPFFFSLGAYLWPFEAAVNIFNGPNQHTFPAKHVLTLALIRQALTTENCHAPRAAQNCVWQKPKVLLFRMEIPKIWGAPLNENLVLVNKVPLWSLPIWQMSHIRQARRLKAKVTQVVHFKIRQNINSETRMLKSRDSSTGANICMRGIYEDIRSISRRGFGGR